MADKLQELTDKLYNEGLSKGKQEGERILADAKQKATSIIEEAKAEAQSILQQAQKEAEDLRTKVGSDIRMASDQCLHGWQVQAHRRGARQRSRRLWERRGNGKYRSVRKLHTSRFTVERE